MAKHTKVKTDIIRTARMRKAEQSRRVRKPKKPKTIKPVKELPPEMQARVFQPGVATNPAGGVPGKRLLTRIKEILAMRSIMKDENGNLKECTRFDDVADAYVQQMEKGNFQHLHEYIEREEGKVAQTITINDDAIKQYVNTPIDGPDAP